MIQLDGVTLARGSRVLLEAADLRIHAGWRAGLIGANGSGKSSLFAALRGELGTEAGDLHLPAGWVVASVLQETPALSAPALDYVLDGDERLRTLERRLAAAESSGDGAAIGECHAALATMDGYSARARAAELLAGLGFRHAEMEQPVASFSGGWRMRLNLARALIARADLLLLDEPTNHLDLEAIVWLERWLATYPGTLLVISHDREFLDGCVSHIVHLQRCRLVAYPGNYSAFEKQRAEQLAVQQAAHARQQREIARIDAFVRRFRAKATKARQVQSRLKALDRLQRVAAAHVDSPFDFSFPDPERAPNPLLGLTDAALGYADKPLLEPLTLQLRPGQRLGLLGPNGAGKSTLMRALAGDLKPQAGRRTEGYGLEIGYFAQHQLEQLEPDASPLAHLSRREPRTREQDLRDFLGRFDFDGNLAETPVERLSGGERARLVLALIVRQRPNLLLLDEPTNHLDLDMRHALATALAGFEGSMVVVSHDRALLDSVCEEFWLVADGQAQPFDGDLADYLDWASSRMRNQGTRPDTGREDRRRSREAADSRRQEWIQKRRPLLRECTRLEQEIEQSRRQLADIDTRLADPLLYDQSGAAAMTELAQTRANLTDRLATAEERWLEAQLELEALGPLETAQAGP
ncbi:MAG: ATP-binding cassette domain-containing protein [Steroidobacteraceae bacterium]